MLESGSCENSVDLRMWIGTHSLRRRQPILKRLRTEAGGQLDIYKRETRSVNFITMAGNQAGVVRGRWTASAWEVSPLGEELALFQWKKGRVFSNVYMVDFITYNLPVQQRDTYCTVEARNCYNSFREFSRRPHTSLINKRPVRGVMWSHDLSKFEFSWHPRRGGRHWLCVKTSKLGQLGW